MDTNKLPSFKILICLVKIWEQSGSEDFSSEPESAMMLTEVESLSISDSYKQLFNTASVRFPRGTIIKKTLTKYNSERADIEASVEDTGVLVTQRADSYKAKVSHFKVGQRIRIRIGYTEDPKIAALAKPNSQNRSIFNDINYRIKYENSMKIMFDGYITKCSIDEPIELQCEDLASKLKKITCPKITPTKDLTVNDLLSDKGKHKLLSKSGLKLHPDTEAIEINIGKVPIPEDLTVADVLTTWAKKARLYSYVKPDSRGIPCLAVGRAYFSSTDKDSILKGKDNNVPEIRFDYHVANNGLTLMDTDKAFLAVEATSMELRDGKEKFYHITIRKNPEYNPDVAGSKEWQVLNETTITKKDMKCGATIMSKSKDRVDLSSYTIVPYMSRKINISHEDLISEAIKYFESYNMNGIEGSLTIFGDLNLQSATKVRLRDDRYPAKNGYYLVSEVETEFGVGGYRQTIKLPYCLSRDSKTKK